MGERNRSCAPGGGDRATSGDRPERSGPGGSVRATVSEPTMQATALTSDGPRAGSSDVSAHFINNVLAAAASYIDEDPDLARDVLAELGQFLAYGLRSAPEPATLGRELDHLSTYLRLQDARFPDRIDAAIPAAVEFAQAPTEIAAGSHGSILRQM